MWRQNLFCLRRRTLAGGLVSSREQESRVLWLESQQPASSIFPMISRHGSGVLYFSVVGQSCGYSSLWPMLPVVTLNEQAL